MYLYHYSKERYDALKTKRLTVTYSAEELAEIAATTKFRSKPGDYIDHISFFMGPLPAKTIGTVFRNANHAVWVNGNELYEYVVSVHDLPDNFIFELVESPTDVKILYDTDWQYGDREWVRQYMKETSNRKLKSGEVGNDIPGLLRQMRKYHGKLEYYYQQSTLLSDWEENNQKYAASVPHLMLYPEGGIIPWRGINRITIGSDKRTQV